MSSPWKDGKGDIIKEISEACAAHGLKFGVYLSPWDRNHPDYGKPEYIDVFREQLRELLTGYGDIFEVWFDGANGGTGYYGGANEERRVDKKSYYDWENTYAIIRELQPDAVIFGDAGPDVRWVGNEHGFAYETTWSNLMRDSIYAGMPEYSEKYASGQENGTHWVPAEADVSIRPGWYYHEYEDHKVKSLPDLLDIYYNSIGRNSSFLLNFPVDKRGLIHEKDIEQLQKLTEKLKEDFAENLVEKSTAVASDDYRGRGFGPENVIDGNMETYWATPEGNVTGEITLQFPSPITFNRLLVQEYIPLGQRIKAFKVEVETEEGWETVEKGTTVGHKRILRLRDTTTDKVRFTIVDAKAAPTLHNLALYFAPKLVLSPEVRRDKEGMVSLNLPEEGLEIYYTLNGEDPDKQSHRYHQPFEVLKPAELKTVSIDPLSGKISEVKSVKWGVAKKKWSVINGADNPQYLFDGNERTNYLSKNNEVTIDFGENLDLIGFVYLPIQNRYMSGVISHFELYASTDGAQWQKISAGEFGNIANSPIEQTVHFQSVTGRYLRIKATKTLDDRPASFAQIDVLTK
jgi:alpha-L-fucosidase